MTRVYLIRVGIDSDNGGFVAPYFTEDKNILYIPLFNDNKGKNRILKSFSKIKTNYPNINLMDYFPKDEIHEGTKYYYKLNKIKAHYDPEFNTMTYGDNKFFDILKDFKPNDYILFYGSFFPCCKSFKYNKFNINQLKKIQSGKKQFYIFAYLKLKYGLITKKKYKKYYTEIKNNVHIIRGDLEEINSNCYIIKGKKDSGYIKPIRIDNGALNGANYQMNDFLFQHVLYPDKNKRGINKRYCELKSSIIKEILKNKI